ncbi:chordopoxvirus fusion protein [Staphylococcus capitis subsp. urealyticus]|uniref:chordopoxvirus fusion protein n=1 Tax=Staphylococcus capitis TaxID=29388 RepID=UPI00345868B6
MQEFITIRLPKEEYSRLIKSQIDLDFLRSDYDFLNRQYEDMCDRYAELRKDYTDQIQSSICLDKTIKTMEESISILREGVLNHE